MAHYDYKTVAMPQLVQERRGKKRSPAQAVAESVSRAIASHATGDWEYYRADVFSATERSFPVFGGVKEVFYAVLIFRRPRRAPPEPYEEPG